ncbi:FHA domain-containing protein [Luedemannella helvata]|uniref:FHA domain-containing protein n=1 Tax=Luedemannella helvata TaxID=349315 RepID=A0ABP4WZN4_9ACTN
MRFAVTGVLDAIEKRLTTDATLAAAVIDLAAVAGYADLDGGRPVNLLRVGMAVDALAALTGEDGSALYPVAPRALLGDADITSKERMVLGRWADDGLIEVVPDLGDRVPEVAGLTGLPVITPYPLDGFADRHPWVIHRADRVLRLQPHAGGARIVAPAGAGRPTTPEGAGAALLSRLWRCDREDCPSFGPRRALQQPVPRLRVGVPSCPRHDVPLAGLGPRPPAAVMVAVVDGAVRARFAVRAGRPVPVGRAPDDPESVELGPWLSGDAAREISRAHVVLEMGADGTLSAVDSSTNGTTILTRTGPDAPAEQVRLERGHPYALGAFDTVRLHPGVEIVPADRAPTAEARSSSSVLADAPTVIFRPQG